MSLIVFATTSEGIVLSGDSRQSYMNRRGMIRIGSDNAFKIFKLNNRIGIGTTGLAFLSENNVNKSIEKFINEFREENDLENMGVEEISNLVHTWFSKKYGVKNKIESYKQRIEVDLRIQGNKIENIETENDKVKVRYVDSKGTLFEKNFPIPRELNFLVAGYDKDKRSQVYSVHIPGEVSKKRDSNENGIEYGVNWEGQIDVVCRILKGYDSRISNISFIKEAVEEKGEMNIINQLGNLQYAIQWGAMPIQDAVDFCNLMIKTTSAIQRFSDGIVADPGDMPGVGGEVDIAIIKSDTGFEWLNRKKLKFNN